MHRFPSIQDHLRLPFLSLLIRVGWSYLYLFPCDAIAGLFISILTLLARVGLQGLWDRRSPLSPLLVYHTYEQDTYMDNLKLNTIH